MAKRRQKYRRSFAVGAQAKGAERWRQISFVPLMSPTIADWVMDNPFDCIADFRRQAAFISRGFDSLRAEMFLGKGIWTRRGVVEPLSVKGLDDKTARAIIKRAASVFDMDLFCLEDMACRGSENWRAKLFADLLIFVGEEARYNA